MKPLIFWILTALLMGTTGEEVFRRKMFSKIKYIAFKITKI